MYRKNIIACGNVGLFPVSFWQFVAVLFFYLRFHHPISISTFKINTEIHPLIIQFYTFAYTCRL